MAFTLSNGDRFRLTRDEAVPSSIVMELARKAKPAPDGDGTWKNGTRIRVVIERRTLLAEHWTPLKVLRWYRFILQDALTFAVPGQTLQVAQPTRVTPLGVPTTVLTKVLATPSGKLAKQRPPVGSTAGLFA